MFKPICIVQISRLATASIGQAMLTFWGHTEQSWVFAVMVAATYIVLHRYKPISTRSIETGR